LALIKTDVQTSFDRKQQTVTAFIDISGAYDNVLIDILCGILREKKVPLQVVRFFFVVGRECLTLVGYKGLSQGLVLSLFLFNIIGSCHLDDLVMYMAFMAYILLLLLD
jgi:hypothetical protein